MIRVPLFRISLDDAADWLGSLALLVECLLLALSSSFCFCALMLSLPSIQMCELPILCRVRFALDNVEGRLSYSFEVGSGFCGTLLFSCSSVMNRQFWDRLIHSLWCYCRLSGCLRYFLDGLENSWRCAFICTSPHLLMTKCMLGWFQRLNLRHSHSLDLIWSITRRWLVCYRPLVWWFDYGGGGDGARIRRCWLAFMRWIDNSR